MYYISLDNVYAVADISKKYRFLKYYKHVQQSEIKPLHIKTTIIQVYDAEITVSKHMAQCILETFDERLVNIQVVTNFSSLTLLNDTQSTADGHMSRS